MPTVRLADSIPPPTMEALIADTRRHLGWPGYRGPTWNPDALATAKGGLRIYDDMRTDDQVRACLAFRTATILGPGWTITAASGDPADHEFAELVRDQLLGLPGTFEDVLAQLLTAQAYGFSLAEAIYALEDTVRLVALKVRAPHHVEFEQDAGGNTFGVRQTVGPGTGDVVPIEKLVHYVHNPEFGNPYGQSDLRAAYEAWFGKKFLWQCWMTWSERYADPPAVAKMPQGTSAAARDQMLEILKRLQARTAFALPAGWEAALLESSRQPREVFEVGINRADLRIAKALMVPDKVGLVGGTVDGGSYALSQSHMDVALLLRNQEAGRLTATIQEQVIARLASYLDASRPAPTFTLNPLGQDNVQLMVDAYAKLTTAGGLEVMPRDEAHWRAVLKLPEMSEDEMRQREEAAMRRRTQTTVPPDDEPPPSIDEPPAAPTDDDEMPTRHTETPPRFWRALTPAEQRADMAEVAKSQDASSGAMSMALALGVAGLVRDLRARIVRGKLAQPDAAAAAVQSLTLNKRILATLRQDVDQALQAAYQRGYRGAQRALRAARADHATGPGLVGTKARTFFKAKGFWVTGLVQDEILKRAKAVLFNALKGDKPERVVLIELDEAMQDLLPERDAAGRIVNVPARLENIARTNSAEAMNEGRYASFTDPDLPEGFVTGLQYSAVLDDRVRESHAAWDGVVKPAPWWAGPPDRRPPNGYQCRCVLIPLVSDDAEMTPDDELPTVEVTDDGFR